MIVKFLGRKADGKIALIEFRETKIIVPVIWFCSKPEPEEDPFPSVEINIDEEVLVFGSNCWVAKDTAFLVEYDDTKKRTRVIGFCEGNYKDLPEEHHLRLFGTLVAFTSKEEIPKGTWLEIHTDLLSVFPYYS